MFLEYIDLNKGPRVVQITSDQYAKFYQHYLKSFGWFSCLGEWTTCPFCLTGNNRKIRYYFSVIPVDQNEMVGPQILQLSYSRGQALLAFFSTLNIDMTSVVIRLEKTNSLNITILDSIADKKQYVQHDWIQLLQPISVEKAQSLIQKVESNENLGR